MEEGAGLAVSFARERHLDHAADAVRHRRIADQYRVMAAAVIGETRSQYLKLAEAYESLAEREEQLAKHGKISN
jgi:hypothetical protein